MTTKTNIIEFPVPKEKSKNRRAKDGAKASEPAIDMTERRQAMIANERRQVTRTVLSHFIGVFVVLRDQGLQPVAIHDMSEDGLAFDMPSEFGRFHIGENVTMRIYLSHDTYFTYSVKIANVRSVNSESANRHGSVISKNDDAYKTIHYFMKFLQSVSGVARKDNGDRSLGRVD